MIYFLPNKSETLRQLQDARELLKNPDRWCQGDIQRGNSFCINGALFEVGTPDYEMPESYVSEHPLYYRSDLKRGELPEAFWFLRVALKEWKNLVNLALFNDHYQTTHKQVLELFDRTIEIVENQEETNLQIRSA